MAKRDWLKVEGYDDILDSFALSEPGGSSEYVSIRISEDQPASESAVFPPVDLWLPSYHLPKLDGLRKLVQKALVELSHPASDPLVDSLLPLIPLTPAVGREKLARLFSCFRLTSVTQTLVLPFQHRSDDAREAAQPIMIGDFALIPFRSARKVSAALAAKHPLAMCPSPLEKCDGNWSIERTIESVPYSAVLRCQRF